MNLNIWLEIIGYAGTALILVSMMMTSVRWLRWLNLLGSVLTMFYAGMNGTMPVFLLNLSLTVINGVHLYRLRKEENV